jgi:hypothetical protein
VKTFDDKVRERFNVFSETAEGKRVGTDIDSQDPTTRYTALISAFRWACTDMMNCMAQGARIAGEKKLTNYYLTGEDKG